MDIVSRPRWSPNYPFITKNKDINTIRRLTQILGRLGIKCMVIDYAYTYRTDTSMVAHSHKTAYGLGLVETKSLVERIFTYA